MGLASSCGLTADTHAQPWSRSLRLAGLSPGGASPSPPAGAGRSLWSVSSPVAPSSSAARMCAGACPAPSGRTCRVRQGLVGCGPQLLPPPSSLWALGLLLRGQSESPPFTWQPSGSAEAYGGTGPWSCWLCASEAATLVPSISQRSRPGLREVIAAQGPLARERQLAQERTGDCEVQVPRPLRSSSTFVRWENACSDGAHSLRGRQPCFPRQGWAGALPWLRHVKVVQVGWALGDFKDVWTF